ncbi:MAG: hypothetical protein M3070_16220 [Actinomycetota bacterium]|nr:hypothetical protein [Actinomycetota bacterium]
MTWFRRAHEAVAPTDEDPDDSPEALLRSMFEQVREVNRHAGRLPNEAVVIARRLLDAVREVIETSSDRDLDIHAVVSLRGILGDYLPTTLRTYLALDPEIVDTPRPTGKTPSDALIEQLAVLWSSATDVLDATRAQDADALMSQGSFLRTKFSGSDLDL